MAARNTCSSKKPIRIQFYVLLDVWSEEFLLRSEVFNIVILTFIEFVRWSILLTLCVCHIAFFANPNQPSAIDVFSLF